MRVLALEDFCSTGSGGTPKRSTAEYYETGEIPWIKSGELAGPYVDSAEENITPRAVRESSAKELSPGAILLAMYGATVGQISRLRIRAATNQAICHIYPDESICDPDYLYRYLQSSKRRMLSARVGGGQPNISQKIIRNLPVPLPPLAEQKRIAKFLDAADALRAKRRESLAQLDALLQSTFLEMFGDPVENPKGWEVAMLEELVVPGDRINYGVVQPGDDLPKGRPLVRVGDFDSGELELKRLKRIDPTIEAKYKRSRLNGTELLVSCVGSIGNVCKVPEEAKGFNIARAVARVPLDHTIQWEYVLYALRSPRVQSYFRNSTRTVSQPTLNIGLIKKTTLPVAPSAERSEFADFVSRAAGYRDSLEKSAADFDHLFSSIQQRAFAGQL